VSRAFAKLFSKFHFPFFSFSLSSLTGRDLPVNVAASFSVNLGGKPRKISVEAVAGVENVGFKHAGQVIVFEVPSSYSSPI
jgi:hypothetical protein